MAPLILNFVADLLPSIITVFILVAGQFTCPGGSSGTSTRLCSRLAPSCQNGYRCYVHPVIDVGICCRKANSFGKVFIKHYNRCGTIFLCFLKIRFHMLQILNNVSFLEPNTCRDGTGAGARCGRFHIPSNCPSGWQCEGAGSPNLMDFAFCCKASGMCKPT